MFSLLRIHLVLGSLKFDILYGHVVIQLKFRLFYLTLPYGCSFVRTQKCTLLRIPALNQQIKIRQTVNCHYLMTLNCH